jgi:hypothetical protein
MKETSTTTKQKSKRVNEAGREGYPISLAPLSFDEALQGLLQVKPESKIGPKKKVGQKKREKKG